MSVACVAEYRIRGTTTTEQMEIFPITSNTMHVFLTKKFTCLSPASAARSEIVEYRKL